MSNAWDINWKPDFKKPYEYLMLSQSEEEKYQLLLIPGIQQSFSLICFQVAWKYNIFYYWLFFTQVFTSMGLKEQLAAL